MKKMPYYSSTKKAIPVAEEPPYLTVGTDVSAKYKGAFCEAKIADVDRLVKLRVLFKGSNSAYLIDDADLKSGYPIKNGTQVEARHPDKGQAYIQATITKITDYSRYTVIFDDGDQCVLRRNSLCLKSGKHFAESETLDQLPLTNPEHFGNPVKVGGASSLARVAQNYYASNSNSSTNTNSPNTNSTAQIAATSNTIAPTSLPYNNNNNPTAAGHTSNDVSKISSSVVADTPREDDSGSSTTNNSYDADENNDFSNNTSSKSSLVAQDNTSNTVSLNESHAIASPNNQATNTDGNKRRGPKGRRRRESAKEMTKSKLTEDTDDDGSSNMSDQTGDLELKTNIRYDTIDIGVRLRVKYGKGKQLKVYEAKVNKIDAAIPGKPRYYVHYTGWNNRYDEWITRSRIVSIVRDDSPRRRKGNVGNKGIPLDALANDEQELKKPSPSSPAVKGNQIIDSDPPIMPSEIITPKRQSRPILKGSSKPLTHDVAQQQHQQQQPLENPPYSITKEKNKDLIVSEGDSSSSKSIPVIASVDIRATPTSKTESTISETSDSNAKSDPRESFSVKRGRRKGRQASLTLGFTRGSTRIKLKSEDSENSKATTDDIETEEANAVPESLETDIKIEPEINDVLKEEIPAAQPTSSRKTLVRKAKEIQIANPEISSFECETNPSSDQNSPSSKRSKRLTAITATADPNPSQLTSEKPDPTLSTKKKSEVLPNITDVADVKFQDDLTSRRPPRPSTLRNSPKIVSSNSTSTEHLPQAGITQTSDTTPEASKETSTQRGIQIFSILPFIATTSMDSMSQASVQEEIVKPEESSDSQESLSKRVRRKGRQSVMTPNQNKGSTKKSRVDEPDPQSSSYQQNDPLKIDEPLKQPSEPSKPSPKTDAQHDEIKVKDEEPVTNVSIRKAPSRKIKDTPPSSAGDVSTETIINSDQNSPPPKRPKRLNASSITETPNPQGTSMKSPSAATGSSSKNKVDRTVSVSAILVSTNDPVSISTKTKNDVSPSPAKTTSEVIPTSKSFEQQRTQEFLCEENVPASPLPNMPSNTSVTPIREADSIDETFGNVSGLEDKSLPVNIPISDTISSNSGSTSTTYRFCEPIDEVDCDKKISILLERLHALRQTYISIKAEVAQIDRRRKKARNRRDRKELRTRSATAAAAAAAAEVSRYMTGINSPSACMISSPSRNNNNAVPNIYDHLHMDSASTADDSSNHQRNNFVNSTEKSLNNSTNGASIRF